MCNSCNSGCFGGMIFPSFVQNSCCNPCCANSSGSVGGASSSNPSGNCTCSCKCNQSGSVAGTSGSNTSTSCKRCNSCSCCGCNHCSCCSSNG